mmetsp:Transcript_49253/g.110899  ORF Transcript_49253/g.110899 Transcript_49253/m.110899 type:complete len:278 (-) Transcript_49253:602-1435(-)
MPAFLVSRHLARRCCITCTSAIRSATAGAPAALCCRRACTATTRDSAPPDARRARPNPRSRASLRALRTATRAASPAASIQLKAPLAGRGASRQMLSLPGPGCRRAFSRALVIFEPRTDDAVRRTISRRETPGTKVMTTTCGVQSDSMGEGTITCGKALRMLSWTRLKSRDSLWKSSSFSSQLLALLTWVRSDCLKSFTRSFALAKSAHTPSETSGYCSLMTTSLPSALRRARCTCPMLAAPSGESSNELKISSRGRPKALVNRSLTLWPVTGGTSP